MHRRLRRRAAVCLLAAAGLLALAPSLDAAPRTGDLSQPFWLQLLRWLGAGELLGPYLPPAAGKHGCDLDPWGCPEPPESAALPAAAAKHGCHLDPDGCPEPPESAPPPPAAAKDGCDLGPDGCPTVPEGTSAPPPGGPAGGAQPG